MRKEKLKDKFDGLIPISQEEIEQQEFYSECQMKKNSYLSKTEFINMIQNISFEAIEYCEMRLISSYIADTKNKEFKILSKGIRID